MSGIRCPCCDYDVNECNCEERWGPEGRSIDTSKRDRPQQAAAFCGAGDAEALRRYQRLRKGTTWSSPLTRAAIMEVEPLRVVLRKVDECERDYSKRMHAADEGSHDYHELWHAWKAYNCVQYWLTPLREALAALDEARKELGS